MLLLVGDEDEPCLDVNLWMKRLMANARLGLPAGYRPRHQPGRAGAVQSACRAVSGRCGTRQLAPPRSSGEAGCCAKFARRVAGDVTREQSRERSPDRVWSQGFRPCGASSLHGVLPIGHRAASAHIGCLSLGGATMSQAQTRDVAHRSYYPIQAAEPKDGRGGGAFAAALALSAAAALLLAQESGKPPAAAQERPVAAPNSAALTRRRKTKGRLVGPAAPPTRTSKGSALAHSPATTHRTLPRTNRRWRPASISTDRRTALLLRKRRNRLAGAHCAGWDASGSGVQGG